MWYYWNCFYILVLRDEMVYYQLAKPVVESQIALSHGYPLLKFPSMILGLAFLNSVSVEMTKSSSKLPTKIMFL